MRMIVSLLQSSGITRLKMGFTPEKSSILVINDERFAMEPDIEAFESSEAYDVLIKAAGSKKLKEVMKMDFTRELLKIDTGDP